LKMQFAVFAPPTPSSLCVHPVDSEWIRPRERSGSFERLGCRPWNLRFVCCTWKPRKEARRERTVILRQRDASKDVPRGDRARLNRKIRFNDRFSCAIIVTGDSFRENVRDASTFKPFVNYKNLTGRERTSLKGPPYILLND